MADPAAPFAGPSAAPSAVRGPLTPVSALGGHDAVVGAVRVRERANLGIVSLAVPLGGADAFDAALRDGYGVERPPVGRSARARDVRAGDGRAGDRRAEDVRVAALQADQFWLVSADADTALANARARMGDAAYLTDQSDAWVALRLDGAGGDGARDGSGDADAGEAVRAALRRMCPLDLDALPDGAATRTVMEHLGVVLLREGDGYTLLSARSSAPSLLHAVELSARYAAPAGFAAGSATLLQPRTGGRT